MQEREISKIELAHMADVSVSFVSDITNGKANPSLKIMKALADALKIPLPLLLLDPNGELWTMLSSWGLRDRNPDPVFDARKIEPGFEEVRVILPASKAYVVKQWAESGKRRIGRKRSKV